ncbi:hypothetical protein Hdeb2414_s0006g00222791 [Helianthus debilis subsp. tardiflorus]
MISTHLLMSERQQGRQPGHVAPIKVRQHQRSSRNTNGRHRRDKKDVHCFRLQVQGPSIHLLLHYSGYK